MLQVFTHTWPVDRFAFAALSIRADDLATRANMIVQCWHEDGLGLARGFCFRLDSGRIFMLQELKATIRRKATTGPVIFADARDVCTCGIAGLVEEIVAGLGLANSDVVWVQEKSGESGAAALVAAFDAAMAKRDK